MGKAQSQKGTLPHLQSRVAYLHKAATYFAGVQSGSLSYQQTTSKKAESRMAGDKENQNQLACAPRQDMAEIVGSIDELAKGAEPQAEGSSTVYDEASMRLMLSHIRGIAKKGQVKVSPSIKHSVCKRCDVLLVDGCNSIRRIENQSREGKKAWADVLVITCGSCGTAKRFPIGTTRQPRRKDRPSSKHGN